MYVSTEFFPGSIRILGQVSLLCYYCNKDLGCVLNPDNQVYYIDEMPTYVHEACPFSLIKRNIECIMKPS